MGYRAWTRLCSRTMPNRLDRVDMTRTKDSSMKRRLLLFVVAIGGIALAGRAAAVEPAEDAYFREGELSGSLKSDAPLALYDTDPNSLVNRLFAAFYIRDSNIPTKRGGTPIRRIEGGRRHRFSGVAWKRVLVVARDVPAPIVAAG